MWARLETFALTAVIPDAAIPDAAAAAGVAPAPPGSPGQELAGTSLSPDKSHAVAPAKKPAASAAGDDDSVPGGNRFAALAAHLPKLPLPRDVLPREREPPTTMAHVTANASSEPLLPEIFVCGSNKASEWDKANCGSKRYVLPGFRITPGGCRAERKEYFFWGGGKGEDVLLLL
ncbi:hypothetical protein T492DRAFT_884011 [Pavlovales sp. CCMP2436]|nr:hypothetical protein T492DRAFT_884011 [Pavlovales sp. CCMP2436]